MSAKENYMSQNEVLDDSTDLSWVKGYGNSIAVTLTNQSSDKRIKAFRYYPYGKCGSSPSITAGDYSYLKVSVGPGQVKKYDIYASLRTSCSIFVILSYLTPFFCYNFNDKYKTSIMIYSGTNIFYTLWRLCTTQELHMPLQLSFIVGVITVIINFSYLQEDIKGNLLLVWCFANVFLDMLFFITFLRQCCRDSQIEYERRFELEDNSEEEEENELKR